MSDFLDRVDGKLFIRNEDTDHDKPIKRCLWWPVIRTSGYIPCWFVPQDTDSEYCRVCENRRGSVLHDLAGDTLRVGGRDGRYGGSLRNGVRYELWIDPRANAVKVEETPIPCPKVRKGIETRFYRGTWQKYLKAAGWTAAS